MFRGHFNIRSGIHGALVTRCHFELLSLGSLSANVTFQCPTGPTLLIVRHILSVKTTPSNGSVFIYSITK
jgi:hypothetical protein